ncbi:hypothetical protein CANARDRAFT_19956 [[Candida] arabinofermentans NRRL YB-2248]|uniref:Uncharacterized protein n=1 Tax=[Candida] arabinofermentans NRRL YB-2248 TaxID=983967 RepID=A0A1E4STP2_9ASCO|nr:hypothetical protein CANARDRAFT_19956 [[Candida] arabinofermentans NRRL YB-2248]
MSGSSSKPRHRSKSSISSKRPVQRSGNSSRSSSRGPSATPSQEKFDLFVNPVFENLPIGNPPVLAFDKAELSCSTNPNARVMADIEKTFQEHEKNLKKGRGPAKNYDKEQLKSMIINTFIVQMNKNKAEAGRLHHVNPSTAESWINQHIKDSSSMNVKAASGRKPKSLLDGHEMSFLQLTSSFIPRSKKKPPTLHHLKNAYMKQYGKPIGAPGLENNLLAGNMLAGNIAYERGSQTDGNEVDKVESERLRQMWRDSLYEQGIEYQKNCIFIAKLSFDKQFMLIEPGKAQQSLSDSDDNEVQQGRYKEELQKAIFFDEFLWYIMSKHSEVTKEKTLLVLLPRSFHRTLESESAVDPIKKFIQAMNQTNKADFVPIYVPQNASRLSPVLAVGRQIAKRMPRFKNSNNMNRLNNAFDSLKRDHPRATSKAIERIWGAVPEEDLDYVDEVEENLEHVVEYDNPYSDEEEDDDVGDRSVSVVNGQSDVDFHTIEGHSGTDRLMSVENLDAIDGHEVFQHNNLVERRDNEIYEASGPNQGRTDNIPQYNAVVLQDNFFGGYDGGQHLSDDQNDGYDLMDGVIQADIEIMTNTDPEFLSNVESTQGSKCHFEE